MKFKKASLVALIAGGALAVVNTPAQAATILFGNEGILFDTDTIIDLEFLSSNGEYQSAFGFVTLEDGEAGEFTSVFSENAPGYDLPIVGDFLGTFPETVSDRTAQFIFAANVEYSFALRTGSNILYSTSSLNSGGTQQARFTGGDDLVNTAATVAFDDRGNGPDFDYNDFVVSVKDPVPTASVPEPATWAGLGMVAGSMALFRRRQRKQVS